MKSHWIQRASLVLALILFAASSSWAQQRQPAPVGITSVELDRSALPAFSQSALHAQHVKPTASPRGGGWQTILETNFQEDGIEDIFDILDPAEVGQQWGTGAAVDGCPVD